DLGTHQSVFFDFLPDSLTVSIRPTELRVINVEDLSSGVPQPKALLDHVAEVTGSAASKRDRQLTNVGPSVHYRLVGSDGQSFEYVNYMAPIMLDDFPVFLVGMRRDESESLRYVRIPADGRSTMAEYMRLYAAIEDGELVRQEIGRAHVRT